MKRILKTWIVLVVCGAFVPVAAYAQAQASITGVVKDTSGAVVPGATVEASSPALIEKSRTVTSDGAGQYRIIDLRPGPYVVTFSLSGFSTLKREGIELSGSFTATVNAELRVGTIGETLTVTAVLDLFRGREWEESWEVTLPEDTPQGDTEIIAGSGPAIDGLDRRILERQIVQAGGLGDLIRLASRQRKSRTLYLRLSRRAPTAIVRSEVLPDLPLSIFSVFNNPRLSADTTLMSEAPYVEIPKDLDVVVIGGRRVSIRVK